MKQKRKGQNIVAAILYLATQSIRLHKSYFTYPSDVGDNWSHPSGVNNIDHPPEVDINLSPTRSRYQLITPPEVDTNWPPSRSRYQLIILQKLILTDYPSEVDT